VLRPGQAPRARHPWRARGRTGRPQHGRPAGCPAAGIPRLPGEPPTSTIRV